MTERLVRITLDFPIRVQKEIKIMAAEMEISMKELLLIAWEYYKSRRFSPRSEKVNLMRKSKRFSNFES